MDSIRQALGQRQISYYGFSYGTYLGQVYSTLFPSHVRRLILDSNVDPRGVWYQDNLDQDVAFERNINIWFGWLAKYNSVYHLGSTEAAVAQDCSTRPRTRWRASRPAVRSVPTSGPTSSWRPATTSRPGWTSAACSPSGSTTPAPILGRRSGQRATSRPTRRRRQRVRRLPGGAVQRHRVAAAVGRDASRDNWAGVRRGPVRDLGQRLVQRAVHWTGRAVRDRRCRSTAAASSNALLIDETLDAATPFPGSLEVRKLFPRASLLAEPGGTTHADSLFGNPCVDGTIADYLTTGALPARQRRAVGQDMRAAAGAGSDGRCHPGRGEGGERGGAIRDPQGSVAGPAPTGGRARRLDRPIPTSASVVPAAGADPAGMCVRGELPPERQPCPRFRWKIEAPRRR